MNIIYRAEDGTEFDNPTDCINYEQKTISNKTALEQIIALDENGIRIEYDPTDSADTFFLEAVYIKLADISQAQALNKAIENAGYRWVFEKTGYYYYNNNTNKWLDFEEFIKYQTNIYQKLKGEN